MNSTRDIQPISKDWFLNGSVSIEDHQALLIKIGTSFGFNIRQCEEFIQSIHINANSYYSSSKNSHIPFRIYLSKMMVYKCIFKISEQLCSQDGSLASKSRNAVKYSDIIGTYPLKLQGMPLTYSSVYILNNTGEFTESEIAQLLNISALKVKERICKAHYFINHRIEDL